MTDYSREQLIAALRKADAAGDEAAAKAIARRIQAVPTGQKRKAQAKQDRRPTSFFRGVAEGFMKPWNNAARALEYGAEQIGLDRPIESIAGALGITPDVSEAERKQKSAAARAPTRGSGVGRFVGNIAGTLPTSALPGGILAQGAMGGALLTDARGAKGIASDAIIGAVAGKVGQMATQGVARAISPNVAPVVQRLKERGIAMTPGQILGASDSTLGRMAKGVEDRVAGLPVVGDVVAGARRRSVESFNRAAFNDALKPIGKTLPNDVQAGHSAAAHVERTLGQAYDDILPRLSAKADAQFLDDLTRIAGEADTLVSSRADQFSKIMSSDVRKFFNPDGSIDGKGLKEIEKRIGKRIRNYSGGADPDARDLADALRDVQSSIRDLAARNNPREAAALRKINEGWARFIRPQRAAALANEGIFTPGQLRTATRVADTSARKGASARGEALMQGLAEDAQSVLPSSVPDSGTVGRLALGLGAAGYFEPTTAIAGGAAMLPYTQAGGKAAEWLLTGRQGPTAKRVSDMFLSLVPVTSVGATALTAQ